MGPQGHGLFTPSHPMHVPIGIHEMRPIPIWLLREIIIICPKIYFMYIIQEHYTYVCPGVYRAMWHYGRLGILQRQWALLQVLHGRWKHPRPGWGELSGGGRSPGQCQHLRRDELHRHGSQVSIPTHPHSWNTTVTTLTWCMNILALEHNHQWLFTCSSSDKIHTVYEYYDFESSAYVEEIDSDVWIGLILEDQEDESTWHFTDYSNPKWINWVTYL